MAKHARARVGLGAGAIAGLKARWTRALRSLAPSSRLLIVLWVAILLVIWQVITEGTRLVNPVFLPAPLDIAIALGELVSSGAIWVHVPSSVAAWSIGYVLAVLVGIVGGALLGGSYAAHRLAGPIVWTLYATPWLAYQPLTAAWFGFGLPPVIFLVFIAALFPVMLNTAAGVSSTDKSMIRAGRVYGASRTEIYRKIVLPAAIPLTVAGMRQAVALATVAMLVAEMTGPPVGLGALLKLSANTYATEEMFAVLVVSTAWTLAVTFALSLLSNRIAPWQTDARLA